MGGCCQSTWSFVSTLGKRTSCWTPPAQGAGHLWGCASLGHGLKELLCHDRCGLSLCALPLLLTALILGAAGHSEGGRDRVMGLEECPDTYQRNDIRLRLVLPTLSTTEGWTLMRKDPATDHESLQLWS